MLFNPACALAAEIHFIRHTMAFQFDAQERSSARSGRVPVKRVEL